jgi:hypothetical protein
MNKEYILQRLQELDASLAQVTANANALMGAKMELQAILDKLEEKPVE